MEELQTIQCKLSVPKGRRNDFGKYSYRTCEDILNALKPLLEETGCTLTVSDGIEPAGQKVYLKATATLTNKEGKSVTATGYAREAETLAGMSAPQVTGTSSSYARKRALCGLFAIDDARDADSLEGGKPKQATTSRQKQPVKQQTKQAEAKMTEAEKAELLQNFALPAVKQAQSEEELKRLYYTDYEALQDYHPFWQAVSDRQKEVGG